MVMKSFIRLLLLVFCCAPPAVVTAETRPLRDTRLTPEPDPLGSNPLSAPSTLGELGLQLLPAARGGGLYLTLVVVRCSDLRL